MALLDFINSIRTFSSKSPNTELPDKEDSQYKATKRTAKAVAPVIQKTTMKENTEEKLLVKTKLNSLNQALVKFLESGLLENSSDELATPSLQENIQIQTQSTNIDSDVALIAVINSIENLIAKCLSSKMSVCDPDPKPFFALESQCTDSNENIISAMMRLGDYYQIDNKKDPLQAFDCYLKAAKLGCSDLAPKKWTHC